MDRAGAIYDAGILSIHRLIYFARQIPVTGVVTKGKVLYFSIYLYLVYGNPEVFFQATSGNNRMLKTCP
jgi:hypothetical protein